MADPRHLLYTDFDGNALDTPEPLVGRGLVDDRHLERVPGLAALVDDPTADPSDRLYACLALTAWGEERGYRAVVAAAGPAPPPWQGPLPPGPGSAAAERTPHAVPGPATAEGRPLSASGPAGAEGVPRARSAPAAAEGPPRPGSGPVAARGVPRAPFGLLAAQVGISDAVAARKGTEASRLAALRALVGVADREDFGDQLGAAIFTGPPSAVAPDVVAATRRGLQRLDRRPWPSFDLPCQLVDILEPLVEVDEAAALALVGEILRRDHSLRTLGYVAFLVATGATPAAEALAAHIVAIGGQPIAEKLASARLR